MSSFLKVEYHYQTCEPTKLSIGQLGIPGIKIVVLPTKSGWGETKCKMFDDKNESFAININNFLLINTLYTDCTDRPHSQPPT